MAKTNNLQSIIFAFLRAFAILTIAHYALVYMFSPPSPTSSSSSLATSSSDVSNNEAVINTTLEEKEFEILPTGEVITEPKKKKREPKVKIVKIPKEEKILKHVKRTTLSPAQEEELEKQRVLLEREELPPTKTNEAVQSILELQSKRNLELDNMVKEVERLNERVTELKEYIYNDNDKEEDDENLPPAVLQNVINEITPFLQLKSFADIENDEELEELIENALRQIERITEEDTIEGVRVLDILDQIFDASNIQMKDGTADEESLSCDTSFLMREISIKNDEVDTPIGNDDEEDDEVIEEGIARESDMNAIVEQIEALIQNRQNFLQQSNTDRENTVSPLMERGTKHFHKIVYQNVQRMMMKENATRDKSRSDSSFQEAREDQALENRIAQFKEEQQQRSCVQPDMIRTMVTQGLDALYKKKDLATSILSVTPLGMGQKPQTLEQVDLDDYAYFVDESLTSNLPSSWKHRGSLRQSIDKPLLYKSLSGLDKLLEYVEGHNDHVDHLIDVIANWGTDQEERFNNPNAYDGSVGKTAGKALLGALGNMKIPTEGDVPEQAKEMKDRAGILVNGV